MCFEQLDKKSIEVREDAMLALVVRLINDQSALVPRGAILKSIDGENYFNPNFNGLSPSEAKDVNNYQLLRSPKIQWNRNVLERPDINYYVDFLDTPDSILPLDCSYSVSYDSGDEIVYIHSLLWMGMHFFHECETQKHGFMYFGNGRKNADLMFML